MHISAPIDARPYTHGWCTTKQIPFAQKVPHKVFEKKGQGLPPSGCSMASKSEAMGK